MPMVLAFSVFVFGYMSPRMWQQVAKLALLATRSPRHQLVESSSLSLDFAFTSPLAGNCRYAAIASDLKASGCRQRLSTRDAHPVRILLNVDVNGVPPERTEMSV